ncbi:hypothetical protein BAE44_0015560 [Dichanthelium oligosanthes]|uniref:Uncharacterized protein n=1 Tax=Dichanthelium oligosanthes TaxID=888268 RepID=A0A1E5VE78_9POAL|nr:hypothetical protein BAE44_0015560 [Dichanthelium oligosanthes]
MASAAAVKMAAIFMLVLTMAHLMAEASPQGPAGAGHRQARRLLAVVDKHDASGNPGLPGIAL